MVARWRGLCLSISIKHQAFSHPDTILKVMTENLDRFQDRTIIETLWKKRAPRILRENKHQQRWPPSRATHPARPAEGTTTLHKDPAYQGQAPRTLRTGAAIKATGSRIPSGTWMRLLCRHLSRIGTTMNTIPDNPHWNRIFGTAGSVMEKGRLELGRGRPHATSAMFPIREGGARRTTSTS